MSDLLVSLNNANNWIQLFSKVYEAERLPRGRYIPIPAEVLPFLTDSRILAARSDIPTPPPTWFTGGFLIPIIDLSATIVGEVRLRSSRIPLRYAGLIILPAFAQSYRLRISIPKWIDEVKIDIWQYVGPIDDSTEKLIREIAANGGFSGGVPSLNAGNLIQDGSVIDGGALD